MNKIQELSLPKGKEPSLRKQKTKLDDCSRNFVSEQAFINWKWKRRVTLKFTMTNGAGHRQSWQTKSIIIRLSDVAKVYNHAYRKYEQKPTKLNLRNFVIIRVSRINGLRNSEIRTLTIEYIDFEERSFQVLDSKKHTFFQLPTDALTLHWIKELIGERQRGYVFIHEGSWTQVKADQPLSRVEIWQIVHDIAEEAGVHGFNPRYLRHVFAYEWYRKMREDKDSKKTMLGLQHGLRHTEIKTTGIYVNKFYSPEDLQREFDDNETVPFNPNCICNECGIFETCKFAPLPSCARSCIYKPEKKEELKI